MLTDEEEDSGEICCSPVHTPDNVDLENAEQLLENCPSAGPVVMTDALDNTWCADCQHRSEFINWGKRHGWPALEIHPYAIAEGAYYWQITATQGDESRIWTFLGLIEMLDERRAEVA